MYFRFAGSARRAVEARGMESDLSLDASLLGICAAPSNAALAFTIPRPPFRRVQISARAHP